MPVVAFEVLSATGPHASRKPAAHADRDDSTPFSEMLDKSDKKPAAKDKSTDAAPHTAPAKDADKDAKKPAQDSAKATAKDGAKGQDDKANAKAASDTAVVATNPADNTTTDTSPADQDAANDFLAAVAGVTGIPVAPVDASKTEAKPADDSKTDDQDKDDAKAAAGTTAPVTADTTATPVAAVVAAPAAAPAATDAAPANSTSSATASVIAEQGIAKAVVKIDDADGKDAAKAATPGDVKADTKTDKPQTTAKLDTALLPMTDGAKSAADPQAAQSQQAQAQGQAQAQTQGQKPAADTAQPAKPAHQDGTPDVAAVTKPADTTQPLPLLQVSGLTPAHAADQAATAPAAAAQATALPVAGIAIEIAGRALDGKKSFDIRLDPPELGKIHVRLDVDHKGEVTSIITADRSDTFDLLRRDAQSLERALQDAGVKTSSNGLQFSLRDQGAGQQNTPSQFANSAHVVVRDDTLDSEINAPIYRSLSGTRAGVDIRV